MTRPWTVYTALVLSRPSASRKRAFVSVRLGAVDSKTVHASFRHARSHVTDPTYIKGMCTQAESLKGRESRSCGVTQAISPALACLHPSIRSLLLIFVSSFGCMHFNARESGDAFTATKTHMLVFWPSSWSRRVTTAMHYLWPGRSYTRHVGWILFKPAVRTVRFNGSYNL